LYEYLLLLASQLESPRAEVLSKGVSAAARITNTIPATEFLGESRIALRHVLAEENGILSQVERDLLDALKQLDEAFDRR
jgi:hypothetical protein